MFPYRFTSETVRKREEARSRAPRRDFLITFDQKQYGKGRMKDPETGRDGSPSSFSSSLLCSPSSLSLPGDRGGKREKEEERERERERERGG